MPPAARRARAAGLDWAQVDTLTDEVLEARVYGPPTPPTHHRGVPDCVYLYAGRRKPGVTLELLHLSKPFNPVLLGARVSAWRA